MILSGTYADIVAVRARRRARHGPDRSCRTLLSPAPVTAAAGHVHLNPLNRTERQQEHYPCKSFCFSASAASARWAMSLKVDGYARNFLLPQARHCVRRLPTEAVREEARAARGRQPDPEEGSRKVVVAGKLEGKIFVAIRQAGDTGQLYASVSTRDIAEAITAGGFTVDRRQAALTRR